MIYVQLLIVLGATYNLLFEKALLNNVIILNKSVLYYLISTHIFVTSLTLNQTKII